MSNEEKDDQADKLERLFQEINNKQTDVTKEKVTEENLIEVDVLNLPPRSEIHQKTNMRFHIDIHRPFWRFFFVVILLLVIISIVYFSFGDQIIDFFT